MNNFRALLRSTFSYIVKSRSGGILSITTIFSLILWFAVLSVPVILSELDFSPENSNRQNPISYKQKISYNYSSGVMEELRHNSVLIVAQSNKSEVSYRQPTGTYITPIFTTTPIWTSTPTLTDTATQTETSTLTPTPTDTYTPTLTSTPTLTPTPTNIIPEINLQYVSTGRCCTFGS